MSTQFNDCMHISFCVIESPTTKEILLVKRVKEPHGWSIPGGKLDDNESALQCIRREVKEETDLDISNNIITYLGVIEIGDNKIAHIFHTYNKKFTPLLREKEHSEFIWTKNYEQMELAGKIGTVIKLTQLL